MSIDAHPKLTDQDEAGPSLVIPIQINGQEEQTGHTLDVVSPYTNSICWRASTASQADAVRAVEAAQAAFPLWSETRPATKREIFLKAADLLEKRADEYAEFMRIEVGANVPFSRLFNLPFCVRILRDIAGRVATISGTVPVCGEHGRSAMIYKEPYGVVLGIAPWNAPYILGMRAIANVIGAGNTTVIKASERSPRCFWALGRAFTEAGLPPGVLNIICCPPEDASKVTSAIIKHPAIKKVNFTGSTAVGRDISILCGQNLKPCLMELGEKNSAIVLPDADLSLAAEECVKGSFLNSGQICMSTDRILIHQKIAINFLHAMELQMKKSFPDSAVPPTQISSSSVDRVQSLVSDALSSGARLVFGNSTVIQSPQDLKSAPRVQMEPVVITGAKPDMKIWQTEIFGLATACMVVDSEEEAIEAANSTECGLSAAVFTEDLRRGLRIAKKLQSGAVHINSMTIHDEPSLPHGGVKSSGWGRFNAQDGLEEFLTSKTVTWKE